MTDTSRTLDNAKDVARKFHGKDLADATVTATQLAPGAVVAADIADASITTAKIADGAVTTAKLPTGGVTTAKLAGSAVTPSELAADAVVTVKILNANVTTAKLAPGAATLAKQAVAGKKSAIFRGKASAGAITGLTGLVVGDRVESVTLIGTAADKLLPVLSANTGSAAVTQPSAAFEAAITVTDQLQQSSGSDLSANLYLLVVVPAAA